MKMTHECKMWYFVPLVLWHCWLGHRKSTWSVRNWVLICCWWRFDWSFAHLIAPVLITTSIILSSNKIQNGDILVQANRGLPGKWLLKWTEKDMTAVVFKLFISCSRILVSLHLQTVVLCISMHDICNIFLKSKDTPYYLWYGPIK